MRRAALIFLFMLNTLGCDYTWDLPLGFPEPSVPADNAMSEAKVTLGRFLFYDVRLSGNEQQSCGSCHLQALAFTDGARVSTGSTGEQTRRNAMSLVNIAYSPRLTWANPLLADLEQQALIPMFGEDPIELGMGGRENELIERLESASEPDYPSLFRNAFPSEDPAISIGTVVRALGAFQRSLLSGNAPYDRYTYQGDDSAMSESALRGRDLFFSERLECFHCHGGFNFSDSLRHDGTVEDQIGFHNTALYNLDDRGTYPADDQGLIEITGMQRDMGRYRAPTLRNIAVTAPYMHDGSIATLEGVIDHYAAGGRTIREGPNQGVGSTSPLRSIFVNGFILTEQEREDLLAFLRSLTDESFLSNPRFSDPFR